MRVLHLVKTAEGATWAAQQAAVLSREGVELHVALPALSGRALPEWNRAGVRVHEAVVDFPSRAPWRVPERLLRLRRLVSAVKPDVIHSHFVGTTLLMRYALGRRHPTPRVFQVPGPLHLEHALPRAWELRSAGPQDFWVASSQYIRSLYLHAGVPSERVFVSYYGTRLADFSDHRRPGTRARFGIPEQATLVGNVNYMYRPKRFLGQRQGLKGHENVIEAIAQACDRLPSLQGLLVGGGWGRDKPYEESLRRHATTRASGRILMPGFLGSEDVASLWPEFDLVVHAPLSENCGGVHEAMIAGTPVLVARVGGLPELVIDGVTGRCVESRSPGVLRDAIVSAALDPEGSRRMAATGRERVRHLFDVGRTASEIRDVYAKLLRSPGLAR